MSKTEIETTKGFDGATIINIDTPELPEDANGPIVRIYLNDECIFENPSFNITEWEKNRAPKLDSDPG